jgi:hypothetical protein
MVKGGDANELEAFRGKPPFFRISFARRSSRFSASSALIRAAPAVVTHGASPASMSACFTQPRTDSTL